MTAQRPILEIQNLHVTFDTPAGQIQAVRGVSFHVERGEVVGLVGESGCGKSVTAQSILRLLPQQISSGRILLEGEELTNKSEKDLESIRGNRVSMIFQDPMTSLNPTMRIGRQIGEALRHRHLGQRKTREVVIELLNMVGIADAHSRIDAYPFSLSGGMRQRVMIAIALACQPALLIADEPTTALDVTIQAQILELIKELKKQQGISLLLITHDLGVVAGMCDRVIVMYAGQVMEMGTVDEIFYQPKHPYTKALLQAIPKQSSSHKLRTIAGSPPDLLHPPNGCPFHPRCHFAMTICAHQTPVLHQAACWLHHPHAKQQLTHFLEDK